MHKFILFIFTLLGIGALSACSSGQPTQSDRPILTDIIFTATETPLSSLEETPQPTEKPSVTFTATPLQAQTTTSPTSTATNLDPSTTHTVKPSATNTFEPQELFQGSFYGVDENHQGSGSVTIVQNQVNEYTLYLENFKVTSGPNLHVILAEDDNPYNVATLGDYLDLGELQSTSGDQMYTLPSNIKLENYGSVVIYCVPFQAIFAIAPIK